MKYLLISLYLLLSGCAILPQPEPKPVFMEFPKGQEAFCQSALLAAQDFMRFKGCPTEIKKSYVVKLHEGTEKVDGAWAWDAGKQGWVAGLTFDGDPVVSWIGCKPETLDEIRYCDAMHEAMEYWSLSNYHMTIHELSTREGWEL